MDRMPEDINFYEKVDFSDTGLLFRTPYRQRRSPIIVTLSDPKITPVDIKKMIEAGMNVAKFKMSHSTKEDKVKILGKVDKATETLSLKHGVLDWPIATAVELKTCIVKTGIIETKAEYVIITESSEITLTYNLKEYDKCNEHKIFIDNPNLATDIKVGMEISIAQDEIILKCKQIHDENSIKCIVLKGGKLTSMCPVSARGSKCSKPYVTNMDLRIIKFALGYQIDIIIINYARKADTLRKVKEYIGQKIKRPLIICGISSPEGLSNIDDLIKESDGIILSREFLTYELEEAQKYRMLQIQKWVGAKCQQAGKPFYISGGVFQEALTSGKFCEHEISDVTNALLDGATGFVLREYTDVDLTIAVIKSVNDLCCTVEPFTNVMCDFKRIVEAIRMPINAAEASALSCATVVNQTNSRVVIIPTVTGRTAKALLYLKPCCIIITVSKNPTTARLLNTYRCVVPLKYKGPSYRKWHKAVEARINFAIEYAVKMNWLEYGDTYVTLQKGSDNSSFCDTVRMWTVSITKKANVVCPDGENET